MTRQSSKSCPTPSTLSDVVDGGKTLIIVVEPMLAATLLAPMGSDILVVIPDLVSRALAIARALDENFAIAIPDALGLSATIDEIRCLVPAENLYGSTYPGEP